MPETNPQPADAQSALDTLFAAIQTRQSASTLPDQTPDARATLQLAVDDALQDLMDTAYHVAAPDRPDGPALEYCQHYDATLRQALESCLLLVVSTAIEADQTERRFGKNELAYTPVQAAAVAARQRAHGATVKAVWGMIDIHTASQVAAALEAVARAA